MDEKAFKAVLDKAKKQPVYFAAGKSKGAPVLTMDIKRSGDKLYRESKMSEGTFGMVAYDGSTVTMTVDKSYGPLEKIAKTEFKDKLGKALSITVVDPGADMIPDGKDDTVTVSGSSAPQSKATEPSFKADMDTKVDPAMVETPEERARKNTVLVNATKGWQSTRDSISKDIGVLRSAILAEYKSDPTLDQLTFSVEKLDTVLNTFDDSLSDALEAYANAEDPAERVRQRNAAREAVRRYSAFLKSNTVLQHIDDNPFVTVSVRKTLSDTLDKMVKVLK